ncbi:MAG TPA: hypothetical protein VIV60_04295 [Polyangiaceae bacterium]
MFAFRFLAEGARSVASRVVWSAPKQDGPGDWMGANLEGTRLGIVAYHIEHLPHWLHDELYRVELRGPIQELSTGLLAFELRLCEQVKTWNPTTRQEFSRGCVERLQGRAAELLFEHGIAQHERIRHANPAELHSNVTALLLAELPFPVRLALEYLNDALGAQQWGLTSCVARICHVALSDQHLGAETALAERIRQVRWLRERLGRQDDTC